MKNRSPEKKNEIIESPDHSRVRGAEKISQLHRRGLFPIDIDHEHVLTVAVDQKEVWSQKVVTYINEKSKPYLHNCDVAVTQVFVEDQQDWSDRSKEARPSINLH